MIQPETRREVMPTGFITLIHERARQGKETADPSLDMHGDPDVPSVKPAKRKRMRRADRRRMRRGKHQYGKTYYVPLKLKKRWIAVFVGGLLMAASIGALSGMWLAGVYE